MEQAIVRSADRKNPIPTRSKVRDLLEIAAGYGLIVLVVWTPWPWQKLLWWIAFITIAIIVCLSLKDLRAARLHEVNHHRSFWVVGMSFVLAAVAVLLALRYQTLSLPPGPIEFFKSYWIYMIWAGIQQFLLQCYFLSRLQRLLLSARHAAVATASLFAVVHLPNPLLTVATVLWGLASCWLYLRYRNLYSLAIAHATLGIAFAVTIPRPMDHNMRIGLGYLVYEDQNAQIQAASFKQTKQPDCRNSNAGDGGCNVQSLPVSNPAAEMTLQSGQ